MPWRFSDIGDHLAHGSGIVELMDDLGEALRREDAAEISMMGGGNPAHIPAVQEIWQRRIQEIAADAQQCDRMLSHYQPPAGALSFRTSVANCLRQHYGWPLGPENVAVTNGGQTAFYYLFRILAGTSHGQLRKIVLPMMPEYIGYADQGLGSRIFRGFKPIIEERHDGSFKYHIDFDALQIEEDAAAICVSRPTNPTGNVLTDDEVARLRELARQRDIPLIIDNAYGAPFPNAVFESVLPVWDPGVILTFSLSKLGLPGARTGILVADEPVIRRVASLTSIVGLANNNLGQAIVEPLLECGELLRISQDLIRPFYLQKSRETQHLVREIFDDSFPYRVHRSEGAFFLWLWFPELPITSRELYERLKRRGVLVIPGDYFFYGLDAVDDSWPHRAQCIRMTFSRSTETVDRGLKLMADELRQIHRT
jgi:valine--pyruvate aminotransferase